MNEDNSMVLSLHDLSQQFPSVRLCTMYVCMHLSTYIRTNVGICMFF